MSWSFVIISHTGNINPAHFTYNGFIYKILFVYILFIFNELYRKYLKMYDNPEIASGMESSCEFFKKCANSSGLYTTNAAIYDQLNADILFRRGNDLYLPTFTCPLPCFNMNGSEWGLKMESKIK